MRQLGMMLLLAALMTPAAMAADQSEEAAVRVPLNHYLQGHATGDPEEFRKAFHPEARLLFMRDGKFQVVPVADFIARAAGGKPAADEAQRRRSIDSIDITSDCATARLTLDYPDVKFTDYMTLLKVDGEWKIVNKSFAADRRPRAQRQ